MDLSLSEVESPYSVRYSGEPVPAKGGYSLARDLTIKEFEEFVGARAVINEQILQYQQIYEMATITYGDLVNLLEECAESVQYQGIDARGDLTKLNAYYTSYIANFGMYLSCAQRMIGSARKEVLALHKNATNEEYDRYFGYKLFCNLRNYALHNLPPLTGIRGSINKVRGESSYEVFFEKEKLLADSQFAKKMSADLESHVGDLHLSVLAEEAMRSLERIHWKTVKALLVPIKEEVDLMQRLADGQQSAGYPYIAERIRIVGNKEDLRLHLVPVQILEIRRVADSF